MIDVADAWTEPLSRMELCGAFNSDLRTIRRHLGADIVPFGRRWRVRLRVMPGFWLAENGLLRGSSEHSEA